MGAIKDFFQNLQAKSRAKKFDNWSNSEKNYQKAIKGKKVKDLKMFDFNAATYSKDLNEFSQAYINRYDKDKDGVLSQDEFVRMATNGEELPEVDGAKELYEDLYDNLNIDEDDKSINSKELASFLYTTDVDWDKFRETGGSVKDSIDGKINYLNYQKFSSLKSETEQGQLLKQQKESFFKEFYA